MGELSAVNSPQPSPSSFSEIGLKRRCDLVDCPSEPKAARVCEEDVDEGLPQEEKVVVETLPSLFSANETSAIAAAETEPSIEDEEGEDSEQFDSGLSLSDADTSDEEEEEEDGAVEDEEDEEEEDIGDEDEDDEEEDDDDYYEEELPPLYNSVFKKGASMCTPSPPRPTSSSSTRSWPSTATTAPAYPPQAAPPLPSMQSKEAFGFLTNSSSERIECAENGKSYMQLGAPLSSPVHHHHHRLPVTPVLQPKTGVLRRSPAPQLPPPMAGASAANVARLPGDHSDCLRRQDLPCYRSMRARMLSQSLHKLHISRQNQEASLRRTVLICNTLRRIEEESERETIARNHQQYLFHQQQQQYRYEQQQQQWQQQQAVAQHHTATTTSAYCQPGFTTSSTTTTATAAEPVMMTPCQFNLSVGCPPPSVTSSAASSGEETTVPSAGEDDDKGINWGSVLSLSSQGSDLEPLNNNCFGGPATSNPAWPAATSASSPSGATSLSTTNADVVPS